jgi:hypothetical protein
MATPEPVVRDSTRVSPWPNPVGEEAVALADDDRKNQQAVLVHQPTDDGRT